MVLLIYKDSTEKAVTVQLVYLDNTSNSKIYYLSMIISFHLAIKVQNQWSYYITEEINLVLNISASLLPTR